MGFIAGGSDFYDAFLSYARADDAAHNGWVGDFERYLNKTLAAELARQDESCRDSASELAILRDKTGFPEGGDLEKIIDEKVRLSHFLFIFLGSDYLNSQFCLRELAIFRECVGGDLSAGLDRLYLIVLDRAALNRLRVGDKPDALPQKLEPLWKVTQKSLRIEGFLLPEGSPKGKLVPVYPSSDCDKADPEFHKLCLPIVEELAKKLIMRRNSLRRDVAPAPRRTTAPIVLGAVPPRLERVRAELADALQKGGVAVETIELADLHPKHTERLRERLKRVRLLVLPFDRFAVEEVREVGAGGHLARLKSMFDTVREGGTAAGPGSGLLWWEPSGSPSGEVLPIDEYDLPFLKMIDALPKESRRLCAAGVLANELIPDPQPKVTARVWIEWQESDPEIIEEAKDRVRQRFDAYCRIQEEKGRRIDATLKFGEANWEILEAKLKGKPDGIVIVYNDKKDLAAFLEQEQAISDMEEVLNKKMFPGLFYLRKSGMIRPTEDWSVIRFQQHGINLDYDPEELEDFVSSLFDLLFKKYQRGGA
jgi:hypothetical protein